MRFGADGVLMALIDVVEALSKEAPVAVVVTDGALIPPGPTILFVNPAFEAMTGFSREEILGANPRVLQGPRTSLAARKAIARALRRGERHKTTLINYRKSGEAYRCEIELF